MMPPVQGKSARLQTQQSRIINNGPQPLTRSNHAIDSSRAMPQFQNLLSQRHGAFLIETPWGLLKVSTGTFKVPVFFTPSRSEDSDLGGAQKKIKPSATEDLGHFKNHSISSKMRRK